MENIVFTDLEQDYIDFFGVSQKYFIDRVKTQGDWNNFRRRFFRNANTVSREDLYNLYKHEYYSNRCTAVITKTWFRDLEKENKNLFEAVIIGRKLHPFNAGKKALDYGCLWGFYGTQLATWGYDVTLMDIPHGFFEFLEYLIIKYKVPNIKCKPITVNEDSIEGTYDYIVCSDVLEHCYDPEHALKQLVSHLKDDGYMFLMTWFDDGKGADPSHLRRNTEKYQDSKYAFGLFNECGLISTTPEKPHNELQHLFRKRRI